MSYFIITYANPNLENIDCTMQIQLGQNGSYTDTLELV